VLLNSRSIRSELKASNSNESLAKYFDSKRTSMNEDNVNNINTNKQYLDSYTSNLKANKIDKNANGLDTINKSFQDHINSESHQILYNKIAKLDKENQNQSYSKK